MQWKLIHSKAKRWWIRDGHEIEQHEIILGTKEGHTGNEIDIPSDKDKQSRAPYQDYKMRVFDVH